MPKTNVNKLVQIIDEEVEGAHAQILYKDHFALGCYLHMQGQEVAGRKVCMEVLRTLGFDRRTTYFNELMANLAGNELAYADGMHAHQEVNALFTSFHRTAVVD